MYIDTQICIHMCIDINLHIFVHICISSSMYRYIHTHTHTYTHTCSHTWTPTLPAAPATMTTRSSLPAGVASTETSCITTPALWWGNRFALPPIRAGTSESTKRSFDETESLCETYRQAVVCRNGGGQSWCQVEARDSGQAQAGADN